MYKVYGKEWCVYCDRAKKLLEDNRLDYVYYNIEKDTEAHAWATENSGGQKSVPIIFDDDDKLVGGFDQLRELLKGIK